MEYKNINVYNKSFDNGASSYERLEELTSFGGAWLKIRDIFFKYLRQEDNLLLIGAGVTEYPLTVAPKCKKMTCLDISSNMVELLRAKFQANGKQYLDKVSFIQANVMEYCDFAQYDGIFMNFFLDVFDNQDQAMEVLNHIVAQSKPGTRFFVSDECATYRPFLPVQWIMRLLYYKVYARSFNLAFHKVYDIKTLLKNAGLNIIAQSQDRIACVEAVVSIKH